MNAFHVSNSFDRGLDDLDRLHGIGERFDEGQPQTREHGRRQGGRGQGQGVDPRVQHGLSSGPDHPVVIRISSQPEPDAGLRLDITDHGPGFRLGPAAPPSEHAERGRGLIVLRALADQIEYQNHTLSLRLRP